MFMRERTSLLRPETGLVYDMERSSMEKVTYGSDVQLVRIQ